MSLKALGTLTLDIVAKVGGFEQGMDQAERSAERWRKRVEANMKATGAAVGAAVASVVSATAALVVQQTRAASEITRLAQVSGAGTTEFQRYAAAADMVGIQQEKLSDQLKDFNEKVGEFQQSGGGGMKDFFENIAPKVGITADAFRELSGPQALQLYYDSLEKAGLNQQQMSFYMESMASDTTALIPLLRNGGEGFRLLGDEAERAGAIMDEKTISAADRLSAASLVASNSMAGLRNSVGEQLLPVLSELVIEFSSAAEEGAVAEEVARTLSGTLRVLAASAVGAFGAVQLLIKGYEGVGTLTKTEAWYEKIVPPLLARRIYRNWQENKDALTGVGDDLEAIYGRYSELTKNLFEDGTTGRDGNNSLIERIAAFREEMRKLNSERNGGSLGGVSDESRKAQEAIAKEISALERAAATWGMTADEVKIYDLTLQGATDAQIEHARSLLEVVGGFERAKEEQEAYLRVVQDLWTDEERLTEQFHARIAAIDAMAASTRIASDEYALMASRAAEAAFADAPKFAGLAPEVGGPWGELNKVDQAEEELQEWYDKQLAMLEQFRSERADLNAQWDEQEAALHQEHQDRLADIERARQMAQMAAGEEFFGNMASAAKTFFGENSKLYQAAFAVEKAYAIGKALINVPKSYSDAYAAVVGIPIVGPALAPAAAVAAAAAQVAQAAAIGNINMTGMAHDGIDSIPKTGTWLLEKGERVTTAETSAKLDATLARVNQNMDNGPREIRLINNGPPMRMRQELDGEQVSYILDLAEERVARSMMTDGKIARTMRAGFGVTRTGK